MLYHQRASRSKLSIVSKMDLTVYIQLIFLSIVNIIFTFSGIVSNTLVILSFWKSSKLRKKLFYFMIILFHDGVVVFRFGRSRNESFRNATLSHFLVKRGRKFPYIFLLYFLYFFFSLFL